MKKLKILNIIYMNILFFSNTFFSQEVIEMNNINGIYQIPCIVNGISMNFIFDTGASDVSISLKEANYLIENAKLKKEDILSKVNYRVASGEIIEGTKIIIKNLQIGNIKLQNVEASIIHEQKAPLLLGQSAIGRIGKYSIEGNKLILENSPKSNQVLDEKYGFKNIKFDTHISEFENLSKIGEANGIIYYLYKARDEDLFKLFDIKFYGIMLGFKNNKLEQINLRRQYKQPISEPNNIPALEDFKNIIFSFSSIIGKPDIRNDEEMNYTWFNLKTMLNAKVTIKKIETDDLVNGKMIIETNVLFSKKIERKIKDF
ncbi:retropepsin-like aspartic protease family protein [Polaribacter sp.]|uniref:retropepsin-like aspartic protease family protein n=2 Tax=Polaribacter sp. TaxID=1920175 RepID=UPI0040472DBF